MVVRRKKKSRKLRGSRTHGWGFGKRHRGKGNRPYRSGGVGKRGAHRETAFLKEGASPIGKQGMQVLPRITKVSVILMNIKELEEQIDILVKKGIALKNVNTYDVDLTKLGFVKLLAEGQVSKKFNVICSSCSARAKEKIEKAGGSVVIKEIK
ncbi:MAG: uL15m family ribosomal protein [Candidatus Nanoarchaeia archaeon]